MVDDVCSVMRHPAVGACSQLMELYGQQTR